MYHLCVWYMRDSLGLNSSLHLLCLTAAFLLWPAINRIGKTLSKLTCVATLSSESARMAAGAGAKGAAYAQGNQALAGTCRHLQALAGSQQVSSKAALSQQRQVTELSGITHSSCG
jgi:hypothetical protein